MTRSFIYSGARTHRLIFLNATIFLFARYEIPRSVRITREFTSLILTEELEGTRTIHVASAACSA